MRLLSLTQYIDFKVKTPNILNENYEEFLSVVTLLVLLYYSKFQDLKTCYFIISAKLL